jgi:hypothetical protein
VVLTPTLVPHESLVVPCVVELAQDRIAEVFGDSLDSLAEVPSFLGHKEDILVPCFIPYRTSIRENSVCRNVAADPKRRDANAKL